MPKAPPRTTSRTKAAATPRTTSRPAPTHGYRILLLNGPNLNLLGTREPEIYGAVTLAEIESSVRDRAGREGHTVETFQSNHEGALIDLIHEKRTWMDALLINPGAYTHTSIAIADAIRAVAKPAFEIHLSNVAAREPFRAHSHISPTVVGVVTGFGPIGYLLALDGAIAWLDAGKDLAK